MSNMVKRFAGAAIAIAVAIGLIVVGHAIYQELHGEKDIIEESSQGDTVKSFHVVKINSEWIRNGPCDFRDHQGTLLRMGYYRLGKREGKWRSFENGKLKVVAEYQNDQRNGDYQIFYESGNVRVRGRCANGREEGPWTVYFEDGSVLSITNYLHGLKEGLYREFYANSAISKSGVFRNDQYDSVWIVLNPEGFVAERRIYSKNDLLRYESLRKTGVPKRIVMYGSNGNISIDRYLDEKGMDVITRFFGTYRDLSAPDVTGQQYSPPRARSIPQGRATRIPHPGPRAFPS